MITFLQLLIGWADNSINLLLNWLTKKSSAVPITRPARNSNSMEISPCHNSFAGHQIATTFCTCHDCTAVMPCTKFCSDHCIRIEVRVKRNFHRIWIAMEKLSVKRVPDDTKIRQWSRPSLIQVMVCYFFSINPLPEPMLTYCQFLSQEQTSVKFESKYNNLHSKK